MQFTSIVLTISAELSQQIDIHEVVRRCKRCSIICSQDLLQKRPQYHKPYRSNMESTCVLCFGLIASSL
jgi:hypothetical protein